jgi:predicted dehydrogenase
MNRRHFLVGSAGAYAASPNDRIRVACVGVHAQGLEHIQAYSKMPNVEIAAICDVDESVLEGRLKEVDASSGKRPAGFTDFRKLLDDKSIDAVSIATPNHWHALMTIWACQAGKDVYVEKPCSHNIFEGRQMVAAARKYRRIVQHGTNSRSSPAVREAIEKLREGVIGDVYLARGLCFRYRDTIGHTPDAPVPPGVDYDLWLGPAAKRPFSRNRFHYNWHWNWEYGNGELGNQGAHQMDVARRCLGVRYPVKVSSFGGHFLFQDDQQTPNTQTALFEFNEGGRKVQLEFEVRPWISNHEAGIGAESNGQITVGDIIFGSGGYMTIDNRDRYKTFLGKKQEPGPARSGGGDNWANFIQAVRSRKVQDQNADIEEGCITAASIHLAQISYRLGRTLHFDAKTLTCTGDEEANRMFTRDYRRPFVVLAEV